MTVDVGEVDGAGSSELGWLAERLGAALAMLTEETHLVIRRVGSDAYRGEGGSNRFLQFARFGENLRVESVGEKYLSGTDRLTATETERLDELGWNDPDSGGNYWRHFEPPSQFIDGARLALVTLEEVHGVQYVEQLDFSGSPEALTALGASTDDGTLASTYEEVIRARPSALHLDFWDYDPDREVTCPACAWTGRAGDHQELHAELLDVCCPACDRMLLIAVFPTLEETRAAAASGNQRAIDDLPEIEAQAADRTAAYATLLQRADQLPDIGGDGDIIVLWDQDGHPNGSQVLKHGDTVLWREEAFYESYQRFQEVFELLRERYGRRFRELRPTPHSETWLYGDRLGAPAIIESLNKTLQADRT